MMDGQKKEITDLQAVGIGYRGMNEKEFHAELRYRMSLSVARTLLEDGAISKEEYQKIDTILLKKHQPILGTLLAGKPLQ